MAIWEAPMTGMHQDKDAGLLFRAHPDAGAVRDEIHARPVEPIAAGQRARRVVLYFSPDSTNARELKNRIVEWCVRQKITARTQSDRQIGYMVDGQSITIEIHTEFLTFTSLTPLAKDVEPDDNGLSVFSDLPFLTKSRVDVTNTQTVPDAAMASWQQASICRSSLGHGRSEIATDFQSDANGYTHYEFASGKCSDLRRGTVLRRLLEIDTYRVVSMLGLPLARRHAHDLDELETALSQITNSFIAGREEANDHEILAQLNALADRAEYLASQTRYRFAAARAYLDVLNQRLTSLEEEPVADHTTLHRYLGNRVDPAIATCNAFERRLGAVQSQIARATDLLATRIGLDVQVQNRKLLDRISETTRNQYRLQTTIENISTIALSYYALGILGYMVEPVVKSLHWQKSTVLAIAAPFVIALVYFGIRRLRQHHHKD
jgi:uncharacterized membrane-anchored protein